MDLQDIKSNVQELIDELEDLQGEFNMAAFSDKYEKIEIMENLLFGLDAKNTVLLFGE